MRALQIKRWREVIRAALVAILAAAMAAAAPGIVHAETADPVLDKLNAEITSLIDAERFPEAGAAADAFLARVRETHGEDSAEFAAALSRKGAVLHVQGRIAEADPLFERALALVRKHRPAGHPDIASALNNVGMQHRWLGRFAEATPLLEEALQIREKALAADALEIAESLSNLAVTYLYGGRASEALPLLKRATGITGRLSDQNDRRIAPVLQNLASALEEAGDYKAAGEALERTLKIYAASLAPGHSLVAGAYSRLGVNQYLQGRFEEAERAFGEARARQKGMPASLTTAATLTDFALAEMELGKLAEARTMLADALGQRRSLLTPRHPDVARTLGNLAEVAFRERRTGEALDLIRESAGMTAERDKLDDRSRLLFLRHVKIAWQVYADGGSKDSTLASEALMSGQHAARGDTARTVTRMGARLAARDPALAVLVRELDDLDQREPRLEQEMSHQLSLSPAERTAFYASLKRELEEVARRRAALRVTVAAAFPDYARLVSPAPLSAGEIEGALAPDEAVVFLLPAYDATYVWAVTREGVVWDRVAMTRADAKAWVGNLRAGVDAVEKLKEGQRPPLFDLGFAHDLYVKLFGGIEPAIADKAHLVIVPTGGFDAIPFHMLVKEKPPVRIPKLEQLPLYKKAHWLIRDHAISILPSLASLRVLRAARADHAAPKALAGFANPVFETTPDGGSNSTSGASRSTGGEVSATAVADAVAGGWSTRLPTFNALRRLPPLAETETEVRTIADLLAPLPVELLTARAASEEALKAMDLTAYRTVYFATHGLKAEDIPGLDEPALALSVPAAPSELDDGLLTASEIAALRLDADLVVLSACNTAAPRTPKDEGLSGLAQAFFHAGARALMVSHWAVPSEAAVKLTTATFRILRETPGLRRSEALRRAMLELIDDPSFAMNAYPTFWSPFVIVGD